MALLGMLLLPSDYRGGTTFPHAHALAQLWLDARDGTIHHHGAEPAAVRASVEDWFDPASGLADQPDPSAVTDHEIDIGEHHDSAPVSSDVHLLIMMAVLPVIEAARSPLPRSQRALQGRSPRIPCPPPRFTSATA
jgi:hypothetical protein